MLNFFFNIGLKKKPGLTRINGFYISLSLPSNVNTRGAFVPSFFAFRLLPSWLEEFLASPVAPAWKEIRDGPRWKEVFNKGRKSKQICLGKDYNVWLLQHCLAIVIIMTKRLMIPACRWWVSNAAAGNSSSKSWQWLEVIILPRSIESKITDHNILLVVEFMWRQ